MPSDFQSLPQVFLGLFSLRMIGVRFAILFLVVVGLWAGRGWDQLGPRIRKAGPFIIAIFFAFYWHNNVDKPLYNYGRIPLSEILNMLRTPPPVLQLDPNYRFLSVPSRRNYWAYEKHIRLAFDPWFDSSGDKDFVASEYSGVPVISASEFARLLTHR